MGKKYYITESQMKRLVTHIREDEVLEEGIKGWVTALSLLASIAGVKGQTTDYTSSDIKNAEIVADRLESGDLDGDGVKDLKQYFTQAQIDLNQQNLDKIKSVTDGDIEEYKTRSISSTKAKLNQGYAIKKLEITRDTIWKVPAEVETEVQDTIDLGFSSDQLFKTGKSELLPQSINEIKSMLDGLPEGAKILSATIESSTDKEPIGMGNDVLAQKRAESVQEIISSYVDGKITIETLPEQGDEEWDDLVDRLGLGGAREHTQEYRYVITSLVVIVPVKVPVPAGEKVIARVYTHVDAELMRIKPEYDVIKFKRFTKQKKTKKYKCKKTKVKGKELPCTFINNR
jgi:outer membrane protein OmpA-like peptidoglycan-associated protein